METANVMDCIYIVYSLKTTEEKKEKKTRPQEELKKNNNNKSLDEGK
jgi:hypothetical protein